MGVALIIRIIGMPRQSRLGIKCLIKTSQHGRSAENFNEGRTDMYSKVGLAVLLEGLAALAFSGRMALAQPDVQGTYEGVIECDTRFSNGTREKLKGDFLIEISQVNDNLSILIDNVAQFNGVVFADAKKPEKKAAGAAILCDINNDPADQNIMLNFEIKNADKMRAKIKGTSIFTFDRDEGEVGHCRFKAKRTSTTDPNIEFCVEPVLGGPGAP